MRLTKFNPETGEYEYIEKAKTFSGYIAQRKAVIRKLGEFEDKASDVAEEIFVEIEGIAMHGTTPFGLELMSIGEAAFAKLKKKYIGEDTNVTTNTEEGK